MARRLVKEAVVGCVAVFTFWAAASALAQMAGPGTGQPMGESPIPPVTGYYNGQKVLFVHTEASDAKVAEVLTKMMGQKVLVVPSLAQIPPHLLAGVYVFANGVTGGGPLGFQPDVFDAAPGDAGYTPLRALHLVTWRPGAHARLLRSVGEIRAAAGRHELMVRQPGVVINMPMLTWPGGKR